LAVINSPTRIEFRRPPRKKPTDRFQRLKKTAIRIINANFSWVANSTQRSFIDDQGFELGLSMVAWVGRRIAGEIAISFLRDQPMSNSFRALMQFPVHVQSGLRLPA
jgi:hypothetical protein